MKLNLNELMRKATSPKAYSAYAVIGVIATTVITAICTRKQCKIEAEKKAQTDISKKQFNEMTREEVIEEIKQTAKTYAPAIASAAATIYCIKKADAKWIDYNKLINAGYISARDKMARYRMLAPAAVGAEVLQGFGDRKDSEGVEWFCIKDAYPYLDSDGCEKLYDIYFQSTRADVYDAFYHINRNFQLRGSASVREFFAFLGIVDQFPDEIGDRFGWSADEMVDGGLVPWIDFEQWHLTTEDNIHINMIGYTWEPWFSPEGDDFSYGYELCGSSIKNTGISPIEF